MRKQKASEAFAATDTPVQSWFNLMARTARTAAVRGLYRHYAKHEHARLLVEKRLPLGSAMAATASSARAAQCERYGQQSVVTIR